MRARSLFGSALVSIVTVIGAHSMHAQGAPLSDEERRMRALPYAASLQVDLAKSERLRGGLYVRDLRPGAGDPVVEGDDVIVRIDSYRPDGTRLAGGACRTLGVRIGRGTLLAAVDLGILFMQEGGVRQIVVPPSLGYRDVENLNDETGRVLVIEVTLLRRGQLTDAERGWSGPTHCVIAQGRRDAARAAAMR